MKQLTPSAVAVCAFNILVERSGSTSGARKPDATNTGTSVDRHRLRVSLFAKSAMPSCPEFNPCPAAKTGTSAKTARILIGAPTSATRGPLPLWAGARLLSESEYQEASSRVTAIRAEAGHDSTCRRRIDSSPRKCGDHDWGEAIGAGSANDDRLLHETDPPYLLDAHHTGRRRGAMIRRHGGETTDDRADRCPRPPGYDHCPQFLGTVDIGVAQSTENETRARNAEAQSPLPGSAEVSSRPPRRRPNGRPGWYSSV